MKIDAIGNKTWINGQFGCANACNDEQTVNKSTFWQRMDGFDGGKKVWALFCRQTNRPETLENLCPITSEARLRGPLI